MTEPLPDTAFTWAGIVGGLAAAVPLLRKFIGWIDKRAETRVRSRALGLQAWEDKLEAREAELAQTLEDRLHTIETQNLRQGAEIHALRRAFDMVADVVRLTDPKNRSLARAERILAVAFPLDPAIPADMAAQLDAIDATDEGNTK